MKENELRRLVGQNVRRCRRLVKMTQENLSENSGIAYKYVQEIEGGRANITTDTVAKLSNALDIHPSFLFQPKER